ncbi:MAG: hypothetical protein ACKOC8_06220 [Pirellulales bacterium]
MRAQDWSRRLVAAAAVIAATTSGGCKSLNERYIALEVWKYEKCFGHLPPGFTPPGAAVAAPAAAPPRVCGQQAACCESAPASGCNSCEGGAVVEGGMPAGMSIPAGPGGSPGPAAGATLPTPAGVTAGKPVVISDEVVMP